MARKRIIDPEFWSDEEIGTWSHAARLFYIGLWNFADDEGRFKAHSKLLKNQIFPYDDQIDIEKLKKELNGKIEWYEVNNSQYGFIRNFLKYQKIDRPTPSKLPIQRGLDEDSTNTRGHLAPNIREVNIREVKEPKQTFLDFVLLTKKEYIDLCAAFGQAGADAKIKRLNDYIGSKGKKYENHYFTIMDWENKNKADSKQEERPSAWKILPTKKN